jgi:methylmalonyl-CoA/ethylmalonyl-CoA epimerase
MLKRIDHIGVVVDDLAQGRRFLESLGFNHLRDLQVPERGLVASFYSCGDAAIELIQLDDAAANRERLRGERMARIEHIAVEVDDIEATLKELDGRGIEVTSPPSNVGGNVSVWTKPETSDGYQLQFMQKGMPLA